MTKAIYLALGINLEGEKELLGLWVAQTEGSKFWLTVFNELKSRGLCDCFIACVDGLKGLPEAIEAVFPQTQVQLCIVHKLRNSLKYVPWKERKAVAADLRAVYASATVAEAEQALARFSERWDTKYPAISPSWRADWQRLTVFFDYSPEIRKRLKVIIGSFFIVNIESPYNALADWLKIDDTIPCQKTQMLSETSALLKFDKAKVT